jgi:hypothetical protein
MHSPVDRVTRMAVGTIVAICIGWSAGACATKSDPCQEAWTSTPSPSPDSTWIAVVHQRVCSGIGTGGQDVMVDVAPAKDPKAAMTILSPDGAWTRPDDVTVRWLGPNSLEASVPNRTHFGVITTWYRGVDVHVRYLNDNPADRLSWLRTMDRDYERMTHHAIHFGPEPPAADSK